MNENELNQYMLERRNALMTVAARDAAVLMLLLQSSKFQEILDNLDPECPGRVTTREAVDIEFHLGNILLNGLIK